MAVYLVAYALRNPTRDYGTFFEAIKASSEYWWHYLPDVWCISTDRTAEQIAHALYPHMETADSLLVKRLAREHHGWLPKEAWTWLEDKSY